jgi:hypothetical protein
VAASDATWHSRRRNIVIRCSRLSWHEPTLGNASAALQQTQI